MELQLVVDNTRQKTLPDAIAYYEAIIAVQEELLRDDLEYYQKRMADLKELDPEDKTGLFTIYQAHERHIRELLTMIHQ